jgi:chromosome segregation ATPase
VTGPSGSGWGTRGGTAGAGATKTVDGDDRSSFAIALRGYERSQVDEHLARRDNETSGLRAELAELQQQRDEAVARAETAEKDLREARENRSSGAAPVGESFGFRAEKLLRLAEQEAAEVRSSAGRESAAIVEKARTEAEAHRHEVEQTLIARASLLEQQAAQRTAGLQEREQQVAEQLASAREQADQLHANAVRAAERLREESETAAEQTRRRADAEAKQRLDQAAAEVTRLSGLQSDVRTELTSLAELITTQLVPSATGAAEPPPTAP